MMMMNRTKKAFAVLHSCFFFFLQRLLNTFVNKLFSPKSFEGDFPLVLDIDDIKGKHIIMPDGVRYGNVKQKSVVT